MDPFSLVMGLLSIGGNMVGSVFKAGGQKRQAQLDAFYAEENAGLSDLSAADALARGSQEAGEKRMQGSADIGSMVAGYGASGVDGTVGSAADSIAQARYINELEASRISNNAAREAWGIKVEAHRYRQQAKADRERGNADMFTTLLGGAGDAAEGGYRLASSVRGK